MPVSLPFFDKEIEEYFREVPHDVVVDVGPGEGKFGKMLRRVRPGAKLIAVEIDASYVEQYKLRELYDEVWVQDAARLMDDPTRHFSAVIIGDCIEHMKKSAGLDLVNFLVYRSKMVILKFPVGLPQDAWEGHASEAHVSVWSEHDFAGFDCAYASEGMKRLCLIRGYLADDAEWLPASLMKKLGFEDVRPFLERDGEVIGVVRVDPASRVRRTSRWWMSTEDARWLNLIAWELRPFLAAGDTWAMIDDDQYFWRSLKITDARRVRFNERDGEYWGNPSDDAAAIEEVERLRSSGVKLLAFAWLAFWWLSHYTGFLAYLRSKYRCVVENDRVLAFLLAESR